MIEIIDRSKIHYEVNLTGFEHWQFSVSYESSTLRSTQTQALTKTELAAMIWAVEGLVDDGEWYVVKKILDEMTISLENSIWKQHTDVTWNIISNFNPKNDEINI